MQLKKSKFSYLYVISLVVLFIYPLRHVHLGVDLWDSGYNYANFSYNSLEYMDSMWYFATWAANAFGSILTRLPFGNTMLGMNVYTSLLVSVIAVSSYVFCVHKLRIPAWIAFTGEILAISLCWAPTAVLYNYLTYGILLGGTILLYRGLTTGQNRYLIFAGILLGFNVGVRFSNLVHAGLILAVWYYGFVCKKKISEVLRETGFCMLGYAGAFGLFLIIISVKYGLDFYIESIRRLFGMTEYATDYSTGSMIFGIVKAYAEDTFTYWLKRFALVGGIALLVCLICVRRWQRIKKVLIGLLVAGFMLWIVKMGYCTADFTTYNSIYYPCIFLLLMAMLLAVFRLFDKSVDRNEKLQGVLVLLTIYLSSLGGNNAMYASINNLFFVLPCFLWMAYSFIKSRNHIFYYPFKAVLVAGIILVMIQGLCFGNVFVYEAATGARDLGTEITGVPVLGGMHTGAENAKEMEALYKYIQVNNLQDRECILYGDIPGIAYYMELAPAINIWSDLRSYSHEVLETDLEKLEAEISESGEYPIVIFHAKYAGYYTGDESYLPEEETAAQKIKKLCSFMDKHGYCHTADYIGDSFWVYRNDL